MRVKKPYLLAGIATFIAGAIMGEIFFSLPADSGDSARGQNWQLPTVPDKQKLNSQYKRLSKYFGDGTAASAKQVPGSWQLKGVVREGEQYFALISSGKGKKAKIIRYKQGDTLPDNTILTKIDAKGIWVGLDADGEQIRLYQDQSRGK
jgi:hypothetical protein